MMKRNNLFIVIVTLFFMGSMFSCKQKIELATASEVDLTRYSGTWYEVARFPNKFEKGLSCVTATYNILENNKIEVINKGYNSGKKKWSRAEGVARIPNIDFPGQLKVTFFWPFSGNYYIISLSENYDYALVGDPSRKYLWILSRTKVLSNDVFIELEEIAKQNGFDISKLIRIDQSCN